MAYLVENIRKKQINWINATLQHKKWRPSRLAKEAGVDHSTLSKFLNDPLNAAKLNSFTVEKLAIIGGIPAYQTEPPRRLAGLAEREAEPFNSNLHPTSLSDLVQHYTKGRNGVDPWVMKSRALEHEGYLPDDIMLIDLNIIAADGDIVCAQIYDRNGNVETIMRVYEAPYLVAATSDQELRRPMLVDNDRVVIRGVVTGTLRDRRNNAA